MFHLVPGGIAESLSEVVDENRRNTDLSLDLSAFTQPISERISNLQKEKDKDKDRNLLDISREASVKDLTERLQVNFKNKKNLPRVRLELTTLGL